MNARLVLVSFLIGSGLSYGDFEVDVIDESPVMVSPTRLKQSLHDTPASVSRITKEEIRDLQLTSLDGLFKFVAGMISANASGNQPRINYHGTNGLVPRRMQVIIDGISVYRSAYAEVVWPTLPLAVEDIEVVEVTRSPSSAAYGANSMMAVINIKTKDPLVVEKAEFRVAGGSNGARRIGLSSGGDLGERTQYRVSLSGYENDGYDENFAGMERHDGTESFVINGRINFQYDQSTRIEVFAGLSDVTTELEFRDTNQTSFPDADLESIYATASVYRAFDPRREIKITGTLTLTNQESVWGVCYPYILFSDSLRTLNMQNPVYVQTLLANSLPTGGSASDDSLRDQVLSDLAALGPQALAPWCGNSDENSDEGKYGVEVEFTSIVNDHFRYVVGGNAYRNWIESETFVNGKADARQYSVFGNAEIRVGKVVINLGSMVEFEPKNLDGPEASPRLGVNYRLNDSTTIRAVLSRSIRTPDILEYDRDWSYSLTATTPYPLDGSFKKPFFIHSRADGMIEPEKITAREISVFHSDTVGIRGGRFTRTFDVKAFDNKLDNLVSEKLQFFDYNPTNDGEVDLSGVEIEAQFKWSNVYLKDHLDYLIAHFNYAYIDSDTDEFYEKSLHADHSGAAYLIARTNSDCFASIAYYGNSEINGEAADAFELGGGRDFSLSSGVFTVKGKLVYRPDRTEEFTSSETFKVKNIYDGNTSFLITAEYKL